MTCNVSSGTLNPTYLHTDPQFGTDRHNLYMIITYYWGKDIHAQTQSNTYMTHYMSQH